MIEVPYKYFFLLQEQIRVCLCVCQPDDAVHLSDESLLQEYVINEDGAIYMGTWDNIQCIPWNYGQVTITHKHLKPPLVECDTLIIHFLQSGERLTFLNSGEFRDPFQTAGAFLRYLCPVS